jgi:hypothetical protein
MLISSTLCIVNYILEDMGSKFYFSSLLTIGDSFAKISIY